MVSKYTNFGFPDTTLAPLVGFDLADLVPIDGVLKRIIIDSPSELVGISCFINQRQVLPVSGEITIREPIIYPIDIEVNMKQSYIVRLNNHDPLNTHTPLIVWETEAPGVENP